MNQNHIELNNYTENKVCKVNPNHIELNNYTENKVCKVNPNHIELNNYTENKVKWTRTTLNSTTTQKIR